MNDTLAEHSVAGRPSSVDNSVDRRGTAVTWRQMIKSPRGINMLVVGADIVALVLAFWTFYFLRVNSGIFTDIAGFPFMELAQLTAVMLVPWLLLFWFSGLYIAVHNRSLFDEFYSVLKVILFGCLMIFIVLFFSSMSEAGVLESRRVLLLLTYFLLLTIFVGLGRYLLRGVVRRLRRRGIGLRRTVIVGDSPWSRQLLEMFRATPELGYKVVGTVLTDVAATPEFADSSIGEVGEIDKIIADRSIEVTVLGMQHERDLVLKLMTETSVADTTIKIVPDLYDLISGQARAQHLYGIPLIEVNPKIMKIWEQRTKRVFDVIFSVSVLLFGLPFWLVAALAVKLEDGGPIFYSQERVGFGGRNFMIHKFRSMRTDAERHGITWAATNDSRVTRVGRFLRQSHIDEVPQFWNVLLGEMSFVGPRPERPFFVQKYSELLPSYPRRHRVKPGMTGWNQIQAEELVENVEIVREKLRHDFFYIETMSLRLDFEIILRTIIRILKRKGQT